MEIDLENQDKKPEARFEFIGKNEKTDRLYRLEEELTYKLMECAKEWMKIHDIPEGEVWSRGIPQALFDMLMGWSRDTVKEVIREWLRVEKKGLI